MRATQINRMMKAFRRLYVVLLLLSAGVAAGLRRV
jgi:hypothetical protein